MRLSARGTRITAGAVGSALALGALAAAAPAASAEPASLLASYDFSEASGTVVHDASGAGRDGTVVGGEAWRGGNMQFTGSNYVKMPDNLLAGRTAATIVIETSPTTLSGAKFLWNIGGSGDSATGQFFIQPVAPRLSITKTNYTAEQTAASATKLVEGKWQAVAATIEKNAGASTSTLRFYIDGVQVAQKTDSTIGLADLATHTMNYIGKSAYNGDTLYQGRVSSFRVYSEALPATDIAAVAATDAQAAADETVVGIDLAAVNAQDLSKVETALTLPTAGGVTWTSSPAGIVGSDGAVTRPAEDTPVILTATSTVRGKTATRDFTVTVRHAATAGEQAAQAAAAILLPSVLEDGYVLPGTVLGLPVAWSHVSGAGDVQGGAIAAAGVTGLVGATLEATVGT
ncbi:MAG: LamG domain-containing protein, partial [Actinobacteria bacterium]|nr:LamG domain-containing protein [Actinomycetota bacterium]